MTRFFTLGRFWLWLLPLLGGLATQAQTVNTTQFTVARTGNGGPSATIFPAPGGWLVPGTIRFSTDSVSLSFLRLSPSLAITRSRQYRVAGAAPRTNYGPFLNRPDGLLFAGQASRADCIFSLDTTFALRWGVQILPNIGISILVSHGPDRIVGYPINSVVSSSNGFTRVWGSAVTGTSWRGRRLTSPTTGWRIIAACAPDNTGIHYLAGDAKAPLIKLDTTKVYWSYLLSAGGTTDRTERPKAAANGNLWVPMQTIPATGQPSEMIISQFDTAGTLLWARQMAFPNRYLGLSDLYELPNGDLLIAGYSRTGPGGKYNPMLFRLTATGTLVWAHRWDVGTTGPLGGVPSIMPMPNGRFRLFNSNLAFVDLDANFNGCQFVDETANITSRPATITTTPLPLTMTNLAITTAPQTLINRSFTYTSTQLCTAVGLANDDAPAAEALTIWPQPLPRGAALHLTLPTRWAPGTTHLTLTSALGQTVWRGQWVEGLMLPTSLPPGAWTLTATSRTGQQLHRRLLTE
jgi:hypothetical protein